MPPLFLPLGVGSGPTGKQLEARSLRGAIYKGLEPKNENYMNEPPEGAAISGRETQKPMVTHWVPGRENASVSLSMVPRWRAKEPLCAMGMAESDGGEVSWRARRFSLQLSHLHDFPMSHHPALKLAPSPRHTFRSSLETLVHAFTLRLCHLFHVSVQPPSLP